MTDTSSETDAAFNIDGLSDKTARDAIRRAAAQARHGPVWITEGGQRVAAIISPEMAYNARRLLNEASAASAWAARRDEAH